MNVILEKCGSGIFETVTNLGLLEKGTSLIFSIKYIFFKHGALNIYLQLQVALY